MSGSVTAFSLSQSGAGGSTGWTGEVFPHYSIVSGSRLQAHTRRDVETHRAPRLNWNKGLMHVAARCSFTMRLKTLSNFGKFPENLQAASEDLLAFLHIC